MPGNVQPAVVGATGYAGFELVRLLYRHPQVKKPVLFTRDGEASGPAQLDELYPHIAGNGGFPLEKFSWEKLRNKGVNVLFLATPHEVSREWVPEVMRQGVQIIDLSGAWRLANASSRAVYQFHDESPEVAEQLMASAVYGIPELHRERLKEASLVANAGCYATSIILALAPLLQAGLLDLEHGIVCDSKSGVSGAGSSPRRRRTLLKSLRTCLHIQVFNHRHTGEILEQLGLTDDQLTLRRTCCRFHGEFSPRSTCA